MSQRNSTYDRIERDAYQTPYWVTRALLSHLPPLDVIWEPAAGIGKMAQLLAGHALVVQTDIVCSTPHVERFDFLTGDLRNPRFSAVQAIVTNPPYEHAAQFIERALEFFRNQQRSRRGTHKIVAMLLRVDFDSAVTRAHLFGDCAQFAKKIVLRKRIKWFEADGPGKSPSENHAFFLWDWRHEGAPTIAYAPTQEVTEPT